MADPVKLEILPEGGLGTRVQGADALSTIDRSDTSLLHIEGGGIVNRISGLEDNSAIAQLNLNFKGEYLRPRKDVAIRYRRGHHPTRQDGSAYPFCGTHSGMYGFNWLLGESDFRDYGSGISNYFKWLKYLGVMLFIFCLFSTPPLLFNTFAGSYYNDSPFPIAATTLGNLWDRNSSVAIDIFASQNPNETVLGAYNTTTKVYELRLPGICNEDGFANGHCKIERDPMLFNYSLADACSMLVFWLSLFAANRYILMEERAFRKKVLKVEDFSIEVRDLPDNCTAQQLQDHFDDLGHGRCYDVQIVESTGNAIELCVRRGRLMKALARQDGKIKRMNLELRNLEAPVEDAEEQSSKSKPKLTKEQLLKKINKARTKFDTMYDVIVDLDDRAANYKGSGRALLAYVTFEQQLTRAKILNLYQSSFICNQPSKLQLNGHRINVKAAPAPSTLLWENADITVWSRRRRIALAVLVLTLVLILTAIISYAADEYRAFADFAVSITTNTDTVCEGKYDDLNATEAIKFGLNNKDESFGINCLCSNEITIANALYPAYNSQFFSFAGACADFLRQRATQFGTELILSFFVLVMNAVINLIILGSAKYMRFESVVERESTILKLVFIITFINTALVVLAVNADIEYLLGVDLPLDGILGVGQFSDMEALWYRSVGVEILVVVVLNIFAPHALQAVKLAYSKFQILRKPAQSQSELNDQYIGPEFVLSFRYAQVLVVMFVVLMYSSGMPLLYPLGFISILVTYWIDKYFFLRITRLPPKFTVKLGLWANHTLEWAIIIHLGMGIWAYSSPLMFPTSDADIKYSILSFVGASTGLPVEDILTQNVGNYTNNPEFDAWLSPYLNTLTSRLFKNQSIPLFSVLILVLVVKVFRVADIFWKLSNRCVNVSAIAVERWFGRDPLAFDQILGFKEDDFTQSYDSALKSNQISGITSYNILANPSYAHAFQLTHDNNTSYQSLEESLLLQGLRRPSGISRSQSGSSSSTRSGFGSSFLSGLNVLSIRRKTGTTGQSSKDVGNSLLSLDENILNGEEDDSTPGSSSTGTKDGTVLSRPNMVSRLSKEV